MNPIAFACSHCAQSITVPPEGAGRAIPCPRCHQATLVPSAPAPRLATANRDLGPDFSETLRKARESTDSIFNDQDDEGDSLFGGSDTPRKPIIPASSTPTALKDPHQSTLRIPGLPEPPAAFVPQAVSNPNNPFEDLIAESATENSGGMEASGAMQEIPESEPPSASPWKNLLIGALSLYAAAITAVAAWGWLREPAAKGAPLGPSATKR